MVGAGGWLGRPAAALLQAEPLPYASIGAATTSGGSAVRLRNSIRPDEDTVVVNVSGLKWGSADELHAANAHLPGILAEALSSTAAHLVHVGSAAEYGPGEYGVRIAEDWPCYPMSDYGLTKLEGTVAVVAAMPTATVLRPFNIMDIELPEHSPLVDVHKRIAAVQASGEAVELISAAATRDYVSRAFVVTSIVKAARLRPPGLFNVCSGVGVSTGQISQMVLDDLGLSNQVMLGDESLASSVVGDPARWFERTGLAEALGCRGVVDMLLRFARRGW